MKVLPEMLLVTIQATSTNSLVADSTKRTGIVYLTGTSFIEPQMKVLFGNVYEEIDIGKKGSERYYLMNKDNVKIIFSKDEIEGNILPFMRGK